MRWMEKWENSSDRVEWELGPVLIGSFVHLNADDNNDVGWIVLAAAAVVDTAAAVPVKAV